MKKIIAVIFLISLGGNVFAQECDWFFRKLNDFDKRRFFVSEQQVVQDRLTKLLWRKCLLGEEWSNEKNTCIGTIKTYSQLEIVSLLKNTQWRLPSKDELSKVAHFRCRPAVSPQAFIGIPTDLYVWSSTINKKYPNMFFIHSLDRGLSNSELITQKHPVWVILK